MNNGRSVLPSFFAELQRRNVYKVGAMYAVAGWLLVQIVTQVFPVFHVSERIQQFIVLAIVAGFPVALVLSWIYELTPQGIVKTGEVAPDDSITRATGQKLNHAIIAVLGVAVLVLLAKLLWPHTASSGADNSSAAAAGSDLSIAVLPFENLSDDKANAYFAEGIQDEILTKLAKIGALKVISRTSTAHYASSPDNLPEIAISGPRPTTASWTISSAWKAKWRAPSPSSSRPNSAAPSSRLWNASRPTIPPPMTCTCMRWRPWPTTRASPRSNRRSS